MLICDDVGNSPSLCGNVRFKAVYLRWICWHRPGLEPWWSNVNWGKEFMKFAGFSVDPCWHRVLLSAQRDASVKIVLMQANPVPHTMHQLPACFPDLIFLVNTPAFQSLGPLPFHCLADFFALALKITTSIVDIFSSFWKGWSVCRLSHLDFCARGGRLFERKLTVLMIRGSVGRMHDFKQLWLF